MNTESERLRQRAQLLVAARLILEWLDRKAYQGTPEVEILREAVRQFDALS